ncbi:MAG: GGDEF domain-containing protein [Treponema sp.]|nr:GGDEF domain-containing protein [Treponema sp.]
MKLERVLEHVKGLLKENTILPLEGDLAEIPDLREIHDEIVNARGILASFSEKHHEVLSVLTESLCMEIEKWADAMEALYESEIRFKYLADHDPLTGALNRRSFMERALQELNEAFRHNYSCGVIMIDIDHFKTFNDTYGHQAGDEALRHTVKMITASSRNYDFLGRYGGEEFLFFFCHADKTTAMIIAERIRKAMEDNPVQLEAGPVNITVSLGIALAQKHENMNCEKLRDYLQILIGNADTSMYEAKRDGRNRFIVYNDEKPQIQADKK